MNLKELSPEQQRDAVSHQLKEAEDFTHLAKFGEIRQKHDQIYREVAFKLEAQRHDIETFEQPNKFFKDSARDPGMRQRRRDGSGFVRVSTAVGPQSEYLRRLCGFFSHTVLAELQDRLVGLGASPDEAAIKSAVQQLQSSDKVRQLRETYGDRLFELEDDSRADATRREALKSEEAFAGLKQAAKLGLLLVKRRDNEPSLTAATLWERVWRATDEVYVATEDLKPVLLAPIEPWTIKKCSVPARACFTSTVQVFEDVVRKFGNALGGGVELKFGPLKVTPPAAWHTNGLKRTLCLCLCTGPGAHPREGTGRLRARL